MNLAFRYIEGEQKAERIAADLIREGVYFACVRVMASDGWFRFDVKPHDLPFLDSLSLHFVASMFRGLSRAECPGCRIGDHKGGLCLMEEEHVEA